MEKWEDKSFMRDNKNEINTSIIYSQRLAGFLMQRGFVLVDLLKNAYKENKNVFVFNNSSSLQDAIEEYKLSR